MGNIVWLASYPKSGNTWLRAFLHNLISDAGRPSQLHELTDYFESEADPLRYPHFLGKAIADSSVDDVMAVRPKVHRAIANTQQRGSILTKSHNQLCGYQGTPLHNMEVTAAAIYVMRNPLDVVISLADHFGLSLDQAIQFMNNPNTATDNGEQSVACFLGSWSQHVESWTNTENPQFVHLRYEDMLEKPLFAFAQAAKLLGLDGDKKKIKQAIKFSAFRELQRQELTSGFSEKSTNSKSFFRKGKQHEWITALTEEQIAEIVDQHREMMTQFNYVPPKFRRRS